MLKQIVYIYCITLVISCHSAGTDTHNKAQPASAPEELAKKDSLQNIAYGPDANHKLDIYFPDRSNNNGRTIIYVHGGGWYTGDKTEAVHWAKYFQKSGYTFVCINYRLTHTRDNNIHPSQIQDVDTAIKFVSKNSPKWKIQKDKLIIMGASAGGHLALLYAYSHNGDQRIKIAVSLCGIQDLTDKKFQDADFGGMNGSTVISWYMGDSTTFNAAKWQLASPLYHISETSVPTFLIHGKEDEIVPHEQSVKAYDLLQKNKIPSRLRLLDHVDHDLLSIDLSSEFDAVNNFIQANLPD